MKKNVNIKALLIILSASATFFSSVAFSSPGAGNVKLMQLKQELSKAQGAKKARLMKKIAELENQVTESKLKNSINSLKK